MNKMYVRVANNEKIEELTRSSGEVRGTGLCTDAEYVRHRVGEEMLQHIELLTREMGYPIEYSTVEATAWYAVSIRTVSLFAITKALGWDDEHLREMGRSAPRYSVATKFMLRYFVIAEAFAERLQTYWRHNYSMGSLRGIVIDRSAFVCLSDFLLPPILSTYLEGYFVGVLGMIVGKDNLITVRKTDRWHESDNCYDFILRW